MNTDRYKQNKTKQKLFKILNNFLESKGILRPKGLIIATLLELTLLQNYTLKVNNKSSLADSDSNLIHVVNIRLLTLTLNLLIILNHN